MKERMLLEGVMPERALSRLSRSGVAIERVKRLTKTQTTFLVNAKDSEKIFAIYPKTPSVSSAYTVRSLGKVGFTATLEKLKGRVGVLLGAMLFLALTLYADAFVLKVEIKTDTPLQTEISRVLRENGIKEFSTFSGKNIDLVSAQILKLNGVSFCSLKKSGSVCIVEVRGSSFTGKNARASVLTAKRGGVLLSLQVLRGEGLVEEGLAVDEGTVLARAAFEKDFVVARARLACVYEREFEGLGEKEAFAVAYLAVGGEDEGVRITHGYVKTEGEKTVVRIEYEYVFSVNYS